MDRGYVCLWRKLRDSDVMRHAELLQVFIALLLESEDHTIKKITFGLDVKTIKPGEVLINYEQLCSRLDIKMGHLNLILSLLESMDIIEHHPLPHDSSEPDIADDAIITIRNWDTYQPPIPEHGYIESCVADETMVGAINLEDIRDDQ